MSRFFLSISGSDAEVASAVRAAHNRELSLVEEALDQILRAHSAFAVQKPKPDNPLESARLFLVTRSFNSLRIAAQVLECGYYQQAMSLVRMAKEDQAVAEDCERNPEALSVLLGGEGKLGRGGLSMNEMAERVSPKAKEAWASNYGFLSEHGAHPRAKSMEGLLRSGPNGELLLQPGGHYDDVLVNVVLYYLLEEVLRVFETVAKATVSAGINWLTSDAGAVHDQVFTLWEQLAEWIRKQLDEYDEAFESE